MSQPHGSEFTEIWMSICKLSSNNNIKDKKTRQQIHGTPTTAMCQDLQSPKRIGFSRYPGLNNGDSPGDGEPSQDIYWDSTSPTAGPGHVNTRVVEISDIVNRIAPKDVKRNENDSLLQWIGDSAFHCTPEMPKPSKLARQFDENMQQDRETSEKLNTVEAELHALFDSSTQKVSGFLSQGSSTSARSQETLAEPRQSELKSADKSGPAAHPAGEKGSCGFSGNNCNDFDDDWENDDLLGSFLLEMNPDQQHDTNTKTTLQSNTKTNTTICKPTENRNSAHQAFNLHSKLCPKPKTTNRRTFKLEPNPYFQPKTADKDVSKSSYTVLRPYSKMADQKAATTKTVSIPIPDKMTKYQKGGVDSVKDISDSLWDDGDDDALLYQVCDTVEKISNSQPQQASTSNCQAKQDIYVDRQRKTPVPIDMSRLMVAGASANSRSPRAFVRSNSLPETCSKTVNYQGWNIPIKGASNRSQMSQSHPGSRMSLGTFNQGRDSSGTFQAGNVDMKPHSVPAGTSQSSKSHHTAFKRDVSDSAAISSKVFVTSQMRTKCSAAEIERKKQEALARRRQRMHNTPKP
ncbi:Ewing's tumor-associated antigen 1 [Dissostichus eleginoides]|uniref:Ewing's tumor-associated antigen 1 n=1 Tax=Dissostichus eleginoides TaxID=100907 RepID=A0AAD9CQT8_DISEL|nr:Ewing's tumor-associated antigen 1 [Dissostichus eleginoides]